MENLKQSLLVIVLCCVIFLGYKFVNKPRPSFKPTIYYINRDSLTKENVKYWIKIARIKHDSIVYKQALIESGNLKCNRCSLDSNNLFGFSNGQRYLTFNHWIESIFYYSWWQSKRYKEGDYLVFLQKHWKAEDSTYIDKLK